jgi:hypothetical protein
MSRNALIFIVFIIIIIITMIISTIEGSLVGMNIYKLQLSKYDISSGKITEISKPIASDKELTFEMQGSLATGSDDGVYYGLFYNYTSKKSPIIGIDLETGVVTLNVDTPFITNDYVGLGQSIDYYKKTGEIVVTGLMNQTTHVALALNTKSLIFRELGKFEHPGLVQMPSTSGIDNDKDILYLHLYSSNSKNEDGMISVYEFDLQGANEGKLTKAVETMFNLLYDSLKSRFITYMYGEPPNSVELKYYNTKTNTYERDILNMEKSTLENFIITSFAYNDDGREIYGLFGSSNATKGAFLVTTNVDTHSVDISSSKSCNTVQDCPQTLVWVH